MEQEIQTEEGCPEFISDGDGRSEMMDVQRVEAREGIENIVLKNS